MEGTLGTSLRHRLTGYFAAGTAALCLLLGMGLTRGDVGVALGLGLLFGVLAGALGALVARQVTAPIAALARTVEEVAAGRQSRTLLVDHSSDELAHLAAMVNRLAWALEGQAAEAAQGRDTLAAVLVAIADGVVVLDPTGRTRLMNPAAMDILGVDEVGDRPLFEPARDHELLALAEGALRGQVGETAIELGHGRRYVRAQAAPLGPIAGGAVLSLLDLTERRRVDKMRQQFVANASHELLTPIGTVGALVDALAHGALEETETAQRFLRLLGIEVDRLTALARDLLDLAQAESGELRLALEPTDIFRLAATVVERLRPRAAEAGVALTSEVAADMPPVLADAARLEQVLLNLAHNAVKFTPTGGRATITARLMPEEVVIRVADTGVGIPAADLPRIFERFYKIRTTAAGGSGGGTGLGLAIARHLVQAMQGRLWAEGDLDQGAAFNVALRRTTTPCMYRHGEVLGTPTAEA